MTKVHYKQKLKNKLRNLMRPIYIHCKSLLNRYFLKDLNNKIDVLDQKISVLNAGVKNRSIRIDRIDKNISFLYSYILDRLIQDNCNRGSNGIYATFIEEMLNNENVLLTSFLNNSLHSSIMASYPKLFKQHAEFLDLSKAGRENSEIDRFILWGTQFNIANNREFINRLILDHNKKYAIAELGLISRIALESKNNKYKQHCAYMFDDIAPYYDARYRTRLEELLDNKNLILSQSQVRRARECINLIIKNHLTKYNNQPIHEPSIGRQGAFKVLVVDQTYGDMSILKGQADGGTFAYMLQKAINENPDADIIVKTHPDSSYGMKGYYEGLKSHDNVYKFTELVNPISLINYVNKVYVCTSQFGFEALMCGKEVHTFGMPFYAGWGLTIDEQKCTRRTRIRNLEELFYITYIIYTHYVNPEENRPCEIEEAIDYLLKMRNKYFQEMDLNLK